MGSGKSQSTFFDVDHYYNRLRIFVGIKKVENTPLTDGVKIWYNMRLETCWRDGRAWLNAHDSKSCIPARVSGVRIPLSPPSCGLRSEAGKYAGVIQWQNRSFPSFLRGFDSHRPLQLRRENTNEMRRFFLGGDDKEKVLESLVLVV